MTHRTGLQLFASLRRRALLVACAAMSVTFVASSFTPSPVKAAFPGRNGHIVFPVLQCPCVPNDLLLTLWDFDLFVVSPNGAALQQVTDGPDFDVLPAWSPDGRSIAFTRIYGPVGDADILVTNLGGTRLTNLTPDTPTSLDYGPAYSPDGRRIAFNSDRASPESSSMVTRYMPEGDLYVMDANGMNVLQLTSGPGGQVMPSWSPDGRWIAFVTHSLVAPTGSRRLGLIRPDGSGLRYLTPQGFASVRYPSWSPDGRRIVFSTNDDIWVIDADGSVDSLQVLTEGAGTNVNPAWSPDGKWIAFVSDRSDGWRVFRMRPDGSDAVQMIDINLSTPEVMLNWGRRP